MCILIVLSMEIFLYKEFKSELLRRLGYHNFFLLDNVSHDKENKLIMECTNVSSAFSIILMSHNYT